MYSTKKNNKLLKIIYTALILVLVCIYFFFRSMNNEFNSINSFEKCRDAGYEITTTYPEHYKMPGKEFTNETQAPPSQQTPEEVASFPEINMNPKNSSYTIEGKSVQLQNGIHNATDAIDSTVSYAGNELRTDLTSDGIEDVAFVVTLSGSGSGTFYYLVVALQKNGKYSGTNGVFIGDRIIPVSTSFANGKIVLTYKERGINDSMNSAPAVLVTKQFTVEDQTLVEVNK